MTNKKYKDTIELSPKAFKPQGIVSKSEDKRLDLILDMLQSEKDIVNYLNKFNVSWSSEIRTDYNSCGKLKNRIITIYGSEDILDQISLDIINNSNNAPSCLCLKKNY